MDGRSDESEEGVVVDHAPFKGIQEAMANQDKLRGSQKPPTESDSEATGGKKKALKQINSDSEGEGN